MVEAAAAVAAGRGDAMQGPVIEMRGIEKSYLAGDVVFRALKGVSLTIAQGEFVAIGGPSGSGKSTLMNVIGCLDRPQSGTYLLAGHDVSNLDADARAFVRNRLLGFVFQGFNLLARTSALENVELPLAYRGVASKERRARAARALQLVGLGTKLENTPNQLSGGQQQRVAIARTLAMEPHLILLDEVTSALDPELVGEVLDVVQSLAADGMTMMIVTHEMQFAREVSSRVAFMASGEIVELASPADLFGSPRSDRLRSFLARYQAAHRI